MKQENTYSREGYLKENYRYFHLRDTAGQERDFHFHDFDKIVLLLEGKVTYTVEDKAYELSPWSILLVKRHTIHRALIDKSAPFYNLRAIHRKRHFILVNKRKITLILLVSAKK